MAQQRVSLKDVAHAAGVSQAAVSRVVNNSGYVKESTRARINSAIDRLGYRPNALARGLAKNRSATIGLCLPYLNSPFIASLMEGVEGEAIKLGYDIFMCHTRESPEMEKAAVERMLERQVDGIIVVPVTKPRHHLREFMDLAPTVYVLRKPRGIDRNLIRAADYAAARRSFTHLLINGHRRIGIILGPAGISTIQARWRGIRDAMTGYGATADPSLVIRAPFSYQDSYDLIKGFFGRSPQPTAVYVTHYWASTALLRLVYENRMELPRDLSVVTYESYEEWSHMSPWRIATNIFPSVRMGRTAVRQVHDMVIQRRLEMPENVELDSVFMPMDSVRKIGPVEKM